MNYLVNSLTHKWIFYALSVLVASIAAHESPRFLFLLGLICLICYHKKFGIIQTISVLSLGILAFVYFIFQLNKLEVPLQIPSVLTWSGEYKIDGSKLRGFMIDEQNRKVYVLYKIKSKEEKITLESISLVGQQYLVDGKMIKPSKPAHSYGFEMADYLRSKGALGVLEISNMQYINTKKGVTEGIAQQRFLLKKHIEETFPKSLMAEAQALLIGLQENVDEETTRAYQTLGITHLFAISGLHIAIVTVLFFQGLLRLNVRREIAMGLLIIVLPIYVILAGGAPSVWRSVAVVELILISQWKGRLAIDDALAISFICFVLLQPGAIYQIGFQLSYLATVSLIYSGQIFKRFESWWVKSFLVTFVCQLIVYPLLLLHFYEISISSLIVNIIFVPLFSFIILPINIGLLLISFIPGPLSELLFHIYEPCRLLLTKIIYQLQSLPYQMWNPGKPSIFLVLIAYVSIFIIFYLLEVRAKFSKILIVLLLPIIMIHFSGKLYNQMKISFVNVGQGDCILIELPYRKVVYMIDTGGLLRFEEAQWQKRKDKFEIGRQIVVPYLKGKGINKIDKLIITHADADHVESAEEILQEVDINEIHVSPNAISDRVMNDLLVEASKQRIPIKEQVAYQHWKFADITFQYLWPLDTIYEGNNDSLVLYIKQGDFEALFTGDLEKEGEQELIQNVPNLSNIDLLKAGHHGSHTSSSENFIQVVKPSLTIFSAGKNNRYGHPHEEIVERFHSYGLKTLTTAEVGTIEIQVTNKQMKVLTSNEIE